jgi:hypothetical protein
MDIAYEIAEGSNLPRSPEYPARRHLHNINASPSASENWIDRFLF